MVTVRGVYPPGGTFSRVDKHQSADVERLIERIDKAVTDARNDILQRPLLTGLATADEQEKKGHFRKWINSVQRVLDGEKIDAQVLSARFGYAVEELTTKLLGSSVLGWDLAYQVRVGGTNPDIVASKDGVDVWVDITSDSSSSVEHIYSSKQWNRNPNAAIHAEVGYAPVSASWALIESQARKESEAIDKKKKAKGDEKNLTDDKFGFPPIGLNPEEIEEQRKAEEERRVAEKQTFTEYAESFKKFYKPPSLQPEVTRDPRRRVRAKNAYGKVFGLGEGWEQQHDDRTIGSVLLAMGLAPQTFGFGTWSSSTSFGESRLRQLHHGKQPGKRLLEPDQDESVDNAMGLVDQDDADDSDDLGDMEPQRKKRKAVDEVVEEEA